MTTCLDVTNLTTISGLRVVTVPPYVDLTILCRPSGMAASSFTFTNLMTFVAGLAVCNPLTDGIKYCLGNLELVPVVMPFYSLWATAVSAMLQWKQLYGLWRTS